jgi:chromosomal replication initiation ATPase DnaA
MDGRPEIGVIQALVQFHTGINRRDMISARQGIDVVDARHVAMWLARRASYSFPEIGRGFHRDHSTAMYAVRRIDDLRSRGAFPFSLLDEMQRALALAPSDIYPPRQVP